MDGEWTDGWMHSRTTRNINVSLKEMVNQCTLLCQNDVAYIDKIHLVSIFQEFNLTGN